jgi:hypothetical protein
MFAHTHDEDIVVDPSDLSFCPALSIDALCASFHGPSVDWGRSLQPSFLGVRLGQHHLQDHTGARKTGGRDPPRHLPLQPASRQPRRFLCADNAVATAGGVRSMCPRALGHMKSLT